MRARFVALLALLGPPLAAHAQQGTAIGASGLTQLTGDVTAGPGSGSVASTVVSIGGHLFSIGGTGGLTFTLIGPTTVTLPTSGTVTTTANNLGVFAATTSAQLAGVISDETGSGALAFAASPTFVTPALGAATATTLNGNTITTGTGTLTLAAGKTLAASNSLTLAGTDATTLTFQGTDTYVGRATTDTLTNKTFDTTFSTGNSFKINGTLITTTVGTGAAVLATSPSLAGNPLITNNVTALPAAPVAGTLLEIANVDATNTALNLDAFGALGDLTFRRADGTNASKTAVLSGETLGAIQTFGYTGSAYTVGNTVLFQATENWTGAATGTRAVFGTTATGTTTVVNGLTLDGAGHWVTGGFGPSCGTGCSAIASGNDNAFTVTTGTAQTSITVNFGKTWGAAPVCNVSSNSTAAVTDIASVSTTAITFGASVALSGATLYVNCRQ
jgi:hypothetical protein